MSRTIRHNDARLRSSIAARRRRNPDFWSFAHVARARDGHVLFQYPAMMVSPMQGELLDLVARYRSESAPLVYDPFVGSATTMIESMRRGLPFVGADINPLAILLAEVESARVVDHPVEETLERIARYARRSRVRAKAPDEHWCRKWFRPDVAVELTALARAIRAEPELEVRRFCWATLAEVVRTSGNHRISAPKLQTRPAHELTRPLDPLAAFEALAIRNLGMLRMRAAELTQRGCMQAGHYSPGLALHVADARDPLALPKPPQVVLTSPPYGDNETTMPYGQVSYLPIRWIDLNDIASDINREPLHASKSLDTRSLGGSRRSVEPEASKALVSRSATLARALRRLEHQPEGTRRVLAFVRDLDSAFARISAVCAPGAHLVITIGDRTVRGVPVPTSAILAELLASRGATLVERMGRQISRGKRLAKRNAITSTIREETVLILRAAD